MTVEDTFWSYLRKGMAGRWDAQRHEDKMSLGIADVSYGLKGCDGWIELKVVETWPKREDTPIRVNLSQEQVIWLRQRGRAGAGRVWIFVRFGPPSDRLHLLFPWHVADVLKEGCDRDQLLHFAVARWRRSVDWDNLDKALCA
jgi:hypothetical protein